MMPLNRELLAEFIEKYREHECLWRVDDENYKNREKRADALYELQQILLKQDPIANLESVTKKINNIRSSFNKEQRKVKDMNRLGFGKIYTPVLWYYDSMLFLTENNKTAQSSNEIDYILNETESTDNQIPQCQESQDSNSLTEKGLQSFPTQPTTSAFTDMPFTESSLTSILPQSAAKDPLIRTPTNFSLLPNYPKKNRPLLDLGPIIESMQNKSESINNKQTNEFEDFSNYLANVLKSLPQYLALKAQREIHLLVINARLNFLISSDSSSKTPKMNSDRSKYSGINDENKRPGDDSEYPIFQTDTSNDIDEESEFDIFETPLPKVEPEDDGSVPIEFDPMSTKIKEEVIDEKFENPTIVSSMKMDNQGIAEESQYLGMSTRKKRKLEETQTSDYSKRLMAKSFESNDELFYFGKIITSQLNLLPKDEAKECQMEIQKIIQEKIAMANESSLSRNT